MMQNNRTLTIYLSRTRRDTRLQADAADVSGLFARLHTSRCIPYTLEAFKALPKAQQDDLKDVGAFLAGELKEGRRRTGCVLSRSCIVLDADNLPPGSTEDFLRRVDGLGCCYCAYSTAKHAPGSPRLRAVFPLNQDIPAEQYAPAARLLCQLIQPEMTWFDPSTDQAHRIMYLPAHCQDVSPVYVVGDKPFLVGGALLEGLPDWQNCMTWPAFPRARPIERLAAKQADPTAKPGIVGAFCRVYDVPAAMAQFLPGVYEETATPGRYTFTEGSSWGGAVLYDGGKFLYSNHATDPCGGELVNAFDLVRIHRFGALDDDAAPGMPVNRRPSYLAMTQLARGDPAVSDLLAREKALAAFGPQAVEEGADKLLALGRCAGEPLSLEVLRLTVEAMGVQVRRDIITQTTEIMGMPPAFSAEEAVNTLPVLLLDKLRAVGVKGVNLTAIRTYLSALADANRYNPVVEMFQNTVWDRTPRFTEFLDIIGVPAESFYGLLIRKWLMQCVALAHNTRAHIEAAAGVLTLQGEQQIGKTSILRKLAVRPEWFAEGITLDLRNKDDVLRAVGVWITELGELDSTLRKEQAALKAFLTQKVDRVRAPYAAEGVSRPRHTSFCATVNPEEFLRDQTGDARFWVVPVGDIDRDRLFALPEEWFVQLWAEVCIWWQLSPQGFRLTDVERAHLDTLNRPHREAIPGEEELRELFSWELPPEQWGEFTPGTLKKFFFHNERISVQQLGRALAKLAREDSRITHTRNSHTKVKTYRLPIPQNLIPGR